MSGIKIIGSNRKAGHDYEFLDRIECGIVLMGSELKSLRCGKISFADSHVRIKDYEAFLVSANIAPYENSGYTGHDPTRERKLLLHKREIIQLQVQVEQKGLTLVPVKIYFKNGKIKLEIAVARGRKTHDKREVLKQRAVSRDMQREMSHS